MIDTVVLMLDQSMFTILDHDKFNPSTRGITIDDYNKRYERYTAKKNKALMELKRLNKAEDDYYVTANTILSLASRASKLFENSKPEQKKEILSMVLSNCTLDDEKVHYDLKKPFDTIMECVDRSDWLRGLDSNQQP